jgi:hypothetical protein
MSTRTGFSGYLQTGIAPILLLGLVCKYSIYLSGSLCLFPFPDYLPVYFQACLGASPIASGVDLFGIAFTASPFGMLSGISVAQSGRYRPQIWLGWALSVIGIGLMTLLKADSPRSYALGFEVVAGGGIGMVLYTTYFPVLAPIQVEFNAQALAFFTFLRNFAQV